MKKILFIILISMIFSSNVYANKAKSSASKGTFGSKAAATQQQKSVAPSKPASAQAAPAASTNSTAPTTANAPAKNPSLLQSAMPALVGGAVGSYVGSKLAGDGGENERSAEVVDKKDDHPLTTR